MKTTKTFLPLLALLMIAFSSFKSKEKTTATNNKDFYIYFYCHDKKDYKTIYISEAIHFVGEDQCGQSYDWSPKVERAFVDHIKANFDNATPDYVYTLGSTFGSYMLTSRQDASNKLNEFIAKEKSSGSTFTKTTFNYSCN